MVSTSRLLHIIIMTMKKVAIALTFALVMSGIFQPATAQKRAKPKPAIAKPVEPALQQSCPVPSGETLVTVVTSKGNIEIALNMTKAPITAGNFMAYVESKKLDGASFYRALRMGDASSGEGLIQGGQKDPAKLLPPIAHESTTETGLSNIKGAVSMARGEPGSAKSDFFIMTSDLVGLDANPAATGDKEGYAVFGRVTKGMEIVNAIYQDPIDPAKGPMTGQMLASPVEIVRVRKTPLLSADNPSCSIIP